MTNLFGLSYRIKDLWFKTRMALQKWRYGYNKLDVWNPDIYIARNIAMILKEYVKGGIISYPGEFEDRYKKLSSEEHLEKWKNMIQEVIDGFESYADRFAWSVDDYIKNKKKFEHTMKIFARYFTHLWD